MIKLVQSASLVLAQYCIYEEIPVKAAPSPRLNKINAFIERIKFDYRVISSDLYRA